MAAEASSSLPELDTDLCKSVVMARAYVRLWLALNEVKGRDPHPVVTNAAAVVIRRITVHLDRDVDRTQRSVSLHARRPDSIGSYDRVVSPGPSPRFASTPSREGPSGTNQNVLTPPFGLSRGKSPSFTNVFSVGLGGAGDEIGSNPWDKGGPILPPAAASIDVGRRRITGAMNAPSPTGRSGSRPAPSTPSSLRGPSPVPNPGFGVPRTDLGTNGHGVGQGQGLGQGQGIMQGNYFGGAGRGNGIISASSLAGMSHPSTYSTNGARDTGAGDRGDAGLDPLDDEDELLEYEQEPALVSCLYDWSRYVPSFCYFSFLMFVFFKHIGISGLPHALFYRSLCTKYPSLPYILAHPTVLLLILSCLTLPNLTLTYFTIPYVILPYLPYLLLTGSCS